MEAEGEEMPVTIERTRLNLWNIISIFFGVAVTAFGWGITYNAMYNANAEAVRAIASVQNEVEDIRQQLPAITQLQFQMSRSNEMISSNQMSIRDTNARVDRMVETLGVKLDTMIDGVNQLNTRVEVLTSRINENPRKTSVTQ